MRPGTIEMGIPHARALRHSHIAHVYQIPVTIGSASATSSGASVEPSFELPPDFLSLTDAGTDAQTVIANLAELTYTLTSIHALCESYVYLPKLLCR